MEICDEDIASITLLLEFDELLHRAEIIADMRPAGRFDAGQEDLFRHRKIVPERPEIASLLPDSPFEE